MLHSPTSCNLQVDQFEYEDLGQRATPLFLELFSGDPGSFEVVRSLVEQQGADRMEIGEQEEKVTCPTAAESSTQPLANPTSTKSSNYMNTLRYLLAKGADVNVKGEKGRKQLLLFFGIYKDAL